MESYVERLQKKYGWPLKIHARGYDAVLVDVQPLTNGEHAPIYRFPGGVSLVDEREMRSAEEFYQLRRLLEENIFAFFQNHDLFKAQSVEWYKELALYAMQRLAEPLDPQMFTHKSHSLLGYAAHRITKAIFEEQDLFDPYADQMFLKIAEGYLPWYIRRYAEGGE